jgi:hypothetical protein
MGILHPARERASSAEPEKLTVPLSYCPNQKGHYPMAPWLQLSPLPCSINAKSRLALTGENLSRLTPAQ